MTRKYLNLQNSLAEYFEVLVGASPSYDGQRCAGLWLLSILKTGGVAVACRKHEVLAYCFGVS